jgi:hypothetical protein
LCCARLTSLPTPTGSSGRFCSRSSMLRRTTCRCWEPDTLMIPG